MKREIEITVKVNSSYDKLHRDLVKHGFNIVERIHMCDYYMIDKNIDISNMNDLEILSKCILIRDLVSDDTSANKKYLIYKIKKYDNNGNLIKDCKINCEICNIKDAIRFMKAIGYKIFFKINDEMFAYSNNVFEFLVQLVNDKYVFIEMEDEGYHDGKKYDSIDDMIKDLSNLNIDYDRSDYFVKKAQIILDENR